MTATFRLLLAAHAPGQSAEATLVLGALAAFHGLKADGSAMWAMPRLPTLPIGDPPDAPAPEAPTLCELAAELGLHRGAVRRGVGALAAAGAVRVDAGVHVSAEALRARWEGRSCVIRLSREARELGLRCEPLLLTGLVAGQLDERGRLVMGIDRLVARTGIARRTLQRAIAIADAAGAIHRWTIPGKWQLCLAPGPRREVAQEKRPEPAQEKGVRPSPCREAAQVVSRSGAASVAKRRTPCREAAHANPDCTRSTRSTPEGSIGGGGVENRAEPAAEPVKGGVQMDAGWQPSGYQPDPEILLQSAILRTGLRSRLVPFARLQFSLQLARALHSNGMTSANVAELWRLAAQHSNQTDPGGLFCAWLAGDWRGVLADRDEKVRHDRAVARGAAAAAEDGMQQNTISAGSVVGELLARINRA